MVIIITIPYILQIVLLLHKLVSILEKEQNKDIDGDGQIVGGVKTHLLVLNVVVRGIAIATVVSHGTATATILTASSISSDLD
mgnify:CR=1 FL=1